MRDPVVLAVTLLAAPLFLYSLGETYLWQDEAQTALLARSVLEHGIPMVGEGPHSLSAHAGEDAGVGGIYLQIAWLQAYLTAASFFVFGESAWAARIPFALLGWLCVPLVAGMVLTAGASRDASRIAAVLTSLSLPLIILSRQARYYSLATIAILIVIAAYALLVRRIQSGADDRVSSNDRYATVFLGFACCLAALSFDLTAVGILSGIAAHWLVASHARFRWDTRFWLPWGVGCALLAAWIGLTLTAPSRLEVGSVFDRLPQRSLYYMAQINAHIVPLPLFGALALLPWRKWRRLDRDGSGAPWLAGLLVIVSATSILAAGVAPSRFFRYVAPLIPVLAALAAIGLAAVAKRSTVARGGVIGAVLILVTSSAPFVLSHAALSAIARSSGMITVRDREVALRVPIAALLQEFRDPPRGPVAAVVEHLEAHAEPGDVLVTTYGGLPLKFHTPLTIYGGETAQFPSAGSEPNWVWPRNFAGARWDAVEPALDWLDRQTYLRTYRKVELPAVDRRWENREDPVEHVFTNPGPAGPQVVLLSRQ